MPANSVCMHGPILTVKSTFVEEERKASLFSMDIMPATL